MGGAGGEEGRLGKVSAQQLVSVVCRYAWTISECEHCGQHIGWKFTACKRSLRPQKFWGLSRSSLLPSLQNRDDETGTWRPIM